MKLTKKAAVKSPDHTPITCLLSALCNFAVFTGQELTLSKAPVPSGVTDGGPGGEPPPGKLNVKTGPPLVDILIFSILSFVVFCIFRGCFRFFLSTMDIDDIQRFTIIS